jgi:hypothetical protein
MTFRTPLIVGNLAAYRRNYIALSSMSRLLTHFSVPPFKVVTALMAASQPTSEERALLRWVSAVLADTGLSATTLSDLKSGLLLIRLAERLLQERIDPAKCRNPPRHDLDIVLNCDCAVAFIRSKGIPLTDRKRTRRPIVSLGAINRGSARYHCRKLVAVVVGRIRLLRTRRRRPSSAPRLCHRFITLTSGS